MHWTGWLQQLGWDASSVWGSSWNSMNRKQDATHVDLGAEQEYWFSTLGMLGALLFWESFRRDLAMRAHVGKFGVLFLQRVVSCATGLELGGLPELALERCQEEPVVDNQCLCVQLFLQDLPLVTDDEWRAQLWKRLARLWSSRTCSVLAHHLSQVLVAVSQHIESNVETWGDFDWVKSAAAQLQGPRKLRRVDPHVREWVVQRALTQDAFTSSTSAVVALST